MRTIPGLQRKSLLCIGLLTIVLSLVLAACGAGSGGGSTGSSPAPTPTVVQGYGTSQGCPNDTVVNNPPSQPNVTIGPRNVNTTITAHDGEVIAVLLPFGRKWSGPTTSQGVLELQQPAGYAVKSDGACMWRFVAKGTGTTQLNFFGKALCKAGQMCPMYVLSMPFTIDVK